MTRRLLTHDRPARPPRESTPVRSGLVLLFVAGTLVLAACGSDVPSTEVRPFEEVQASEMTFENDPTFVGRGIFHVTTTEPLICAIVWGETEALGNFNNSLAMNGTGIVEHDVLLPFAEAGETYFYRVQGSTADGTLYQSELMTFTLPMEEAAPPDEVEQDLGENVAEVARKVRRAGVAASRITDEINQAIDTQAEQHDGSDQSDSQKTQEHRPDRAATIAH